MLSFTFDLPLLSADDADSKVELVAVAVVPSAGIRTPSKCSANFPVVDSRIDGYQRNPNYKGPQTRVVQT